jgi:putative ABC transport system permease protein
VIAGKPQPPAGQEPQADVRVATTGYFRTMRIPLLRGCEFNEFDGPNSAPVVMVNDTFAHQLPGEDPLGQRLVLYGRSREIVGIVGDVRSMGASQPAPPNVYVPFAQAPRPPYEGRMMTFIVRVPGSPAAVVALARAAVASIDAELPLANVRPMSEVVSAAAGQPRFTTLVMSFFAGVAFFLAALGLYGILAYGVEQRIREIGIRVALGAGNREIFGLIVGHGMGLALVGVIVGVPAALASTRLMGGVLSGVTSTDPLTYVAVIAMLATSALLASYFPARRATRVDPLVALRAD